MLLMRDMIRRCARNYPTRLAYRCGNRSSTWKAIDERSDRFAAALQAQGYGKASVVGVLSQEAIEVYEHAFACAKIGAVRVGVNGLYAWPELCHVLTDSRVEVMLVDARTQAVIADHLAEIESLGVTLIGYNGSHPYALDYEVLVAGGGQPEWPALEADDVLMYTYTSGTTGVPKAAMLTQAGVSNVVQHSLISFGFERDDVWYMPASSAWAVVLMSFFGIGNGMTTVIPDGTFEISAMLDDIERMGVTVALMVPTMMQRATEAQRQNPRDMSSLRRLIYGSSPASPAMIRKARATFGVSMMQCYGQTETTGGWVSVLTEADHIRALDSEPGLLRSVGRIGGHYDCSIRDENGCELPPGSKGEIWLRGNTLMKGYLNLPDATTEVFRADWLRSNDIGYLDEEGYLFLLDRQKFLIISGAVNVFPTTVEAVLNEHPAVDEVAVIGVPHPEWGEAVVAVVVRAPAFPDLTSAEVLDFCRPRLGKPEIPKHVIFRTELEKTFTGKVKKAEIRDQLLRADDIFPWSTVVE